MLVKFSMQAFFRIWALTRTGMTTDAIYCQKESFSRERLKYFLTVFFNSLYDEWQNSVSGWQNAEIAW